MAQQKPGVMLYFEMRNVFEELSNEKRGILVSAILDYSEHGIQPDFRGSLRIACGILGVYVIGDDRFPWVTADCMGFYSAQAGQGR